jgi:hypothetical protein
METSTKSSRKWVWSYGASENSCLAGTFHVLAQYFVLVLKVLILICRLVTLQSLIADTRGSLNNVIVSINELLEKDQASPLVSSLLRFLPCF